MRNEDLQGPETPEESSKQMDLFELEHLPKPPKQFTSGGQEDLTSTEDE